MLPGCPSLLASATGPILMGSSLKSPGPWLMERCGSLRPSQESPGVARSPCSLPSATPPFVSSDLFGKRRLEVAPLLSRGYLPRTQGE